MSMKMEDYLELTEEEYFKVEKGTPVYSKLSIKPVTFEKYPQFNHDWELTQKVNEHFFKIGLKKLTEGKAVEIRDQVEQLNGEFVYDEENETYIVSLLDLHGYSKLFTSYIKIYKLVKGLILDETIFTYRIQHPGILALTEEELEAVNTQLEKMRGQAFLNGEVVLFQREDWDAEIFDGVKFAFYQALEGNPIKEVNMIKQLEEIPNALEKKLTKYGNNYVFDKRKELKEAGEGAD